MAEERVLTLRELNRALLARQLLLERRKLGVQQAVERLCAIQAQWPQSPYLGLWSRLTGFEKEQLTRALAQHRVVKTQLFRITLHITTTPTSSPSGGRPRATGRPASRRRRSRSSPAASGRSR